MCAVHVCSWICGRVYAGSPSISMRCIAKSNAAVVERLGNPSSGSVPPLVSVGPTQGVGNSFSPLDSTQTCHKNAKFRNPQEIKKILRPGK